MSLGFTSSATNMRKRAVGLGGRLLIAGLVASFAAGCMSSSGRGRGNTAERTAWGNTSIEELGRRYDAKPGEKSVSLAYGEMLKKNGQYIQSTAVLESAAIKNPKDTEVLAAYGKSLIDVGRYQEASEILSRAHTPDRPDWRILSAQGSIADQMGNPALARQYYEAALKIAPGEPTILSNLGLSYALDKNLPEAEKALRQAAASPRATEKIRANYALVLSLQGKGDAVPREAERDGGAKKPVSNAVPAKKQADNNKHPSPAAVPPETSATKQSVQPDVADGKPKTKPQHQASISTNTAKPAQPQRIRANDPSLWY